MSIFPARLAPAFVVCTLVLNGCGSGGPEAGVDHDADYALGIKAKTFEVADTWNKNKPEAEGLLAGLVEQLAAYESFPTTKHRDIYVELFTAAKQVQSGDRGRFPEAAGNCRQTPRRRVAAD
jgi:hypothetical protein